MKNPSLPHLLAASVLLLLATSCEKVVTLDLKETSPRLAIEGNLADDGRPCVVALSRSVNYAETNTFPAVSGAVITLSDDAGGLETLRETTPGQYTGSKLTGQLGRRYTLRVDVEGQTYVAASTLPTLVPLTGLLAQKATFGDGAEIVPQYLDPAGGRNYYYFRLYHNGKLNNTLFVQNDEFTDGKANIRPLNVRSREDEDDLLTGDSVRVEMQNIDANVYEYLRTLAQVLQSGGGLGTASPANPQSNFSGGVLGYFSAHTLRRRSVVVPQL
jgi:hypothetical protein